MTPPDESLDSRLIVPLLRRLDADRAEAAPGDHPDPELLAQFALGQLDPEEGADVVGHMVECVGCRQAVALLLSPPAPLVATRGSRVSSHASRVWLRAGLLAGSCAAAVFLVATALSVWPRPPTEAQVYAQADALLRQGDFPAVQALLADAERRGVRSDRLRNLEAQAAREMAGPVALAVAGRLSDFGFDLDGVVARGAKDSAPPAQLRKAQELLAGCGSDEDGVVLNRGHVLLTLGEPARARAEFEMVAARSPREPLAWLGVGLADYLLQDFAAAERAFRTCLSLDPANVAARINLAMTLEERGEREQARAEWQRVLAAPLAPEDRAKIERAVAELRP
jgi:tetratricopeptide (TPR) repeat protein